MQPSYKNVGECIETQRRDFKIQTTEYLSTGLIPVIDQGAGFIAGYIDDPEKAYTGPLPVIVFGDHTCCLKYVSFRFAVGADGTQLIRPGSDFDVRYFYNALRAQKMEHFGYQRHFKLLKTKKVPWFPLPTQRKIAAILSAYDDLIENNLRRIKILEEMAQNLYREWFVKFRFPGHHHARFTDSPLGPIPEGWGIGRLDDLIVLQRGFDLPTDSRQPGSVIVYAATGPHGFHSDSKVRGPGVVTGRSGTIGVVQYVEGDFWPLNTTLWVKQFKRCTPLFGYYLLSAVDFGQFRSGAAVPTLNRNHIHGLPVVLPPVGLINDFQSLGEPVNNLVAALRGKNTTLRRTRDLLLPRLISGEVDVSELDIAVPEEAGG